MVLNKTNGVPIIQNPHPSKADNTRYITRDWGTLYLLCDVAKLSTIKMFPIKILCIQTGSAIVLPSKIIK